MTGTFKKNMKKYISPASSTEYISLQNILCL